MTSDIVGEKRHFSELVFKAVRRFTFGQFFKSSKMYRMRFGPEAEQIALIPQDLRTADPSFTTEVYHGHFGLAGAVAMTDGASPFSITPPNAEWEKELHGFSWLRHFNASNNEQAILQARELVRDWIKLHSRMNGAAWEPEIVSRRVVSWLCHIAPLLQDSEPVFYNSVMKSLTLQLRYLAAYYTNIDDGLPRLTSLIALNMAGLCVEGQGFLVGQFLGLLRAELNRQILKDGGHISRNPWVNVTLMFDLLPLKQCFVARGKQPPPDILAATQRISPMIRFMRLGDGYLGRFNGMSATLPDMLATILAYDSFKETLRGYAPQSGYCRIEKAKTIILADTGSAPELAMSGDAHAGCLSFEMTSGIYPVIVNCGAPGPANREWGLTARTTPYHSTLSVNKNSSARLVRRGFLNQTIGASLLKGPDNVKVECKEDEKESIIRAAHDGFAARYNVTYTRKLALNESGDFIEGQETLKPLDDTPSKQHRFPFSLHFHIHPDVQVNYGEDRQSVTMTLLNGEVWKFATTSLAPALEESLFLADYRGPRRSLQIVLRGVCNSAADFTWTLEKIKEAEHEDAPAPSASLPQSPARLAKLKQKLIFVDPDKDEDGFN